MTTPESTSPTQDGPPPRAYQVVLQWFEEQVLAGQLVVGDRLPAERDLAHQLGVGRATVREAIRTLQAQGVLHSAVGAGRTGGTTVRSVDPAALSRMLRLHVALGHFPLPHVIEVRVALERLSAHLACEHRTQAHLDLLGQLAEEMAGALDDRERFNDLDTRFHLTLAEAAGNQLATDTTAAIRESMRQPILERVRSSSAWDELGPRLVDDHQAIHRAIAERDAAAAEDLVDRHIRTAWATLTED